MASRKEKIDAELDKQEEVEGWSEDLDLLRRALSCCKTDLEWQAVADCRHHRWGTYSYQVHRFYQPSQLLRSPGGIGRHHFKSLSRRTNNHSIGVLFNYL